MDSPPPPPWGERCCAPRGQPAEVFLFSLSEPVQPTGSRRPSNAAPLPKRPPPPPGKSHPPGSPPHPGARPAQLPRRSRTPHLLCLAPSVAHAPPPPPPPHHPPPP